MWGLTVFLIAFFALTAFGERSVQDAGATACFVAVWVHILFGCIVTYKVFTESLTQWISIKKIEELRDKKKVRLETKIYLLVSVVLVLIQWLPALLCLGPILARSSEQALGSILVYSLSTLAITIQSLQLAIQRTPSSRSLP